MIEELNGDFIQWLRGFYYVAQTGSLRRAAQMMNRNPSTISYQLHSLEQELNTVLFDRYKKSLKITPEGKKLLEWTIYTFETLRGLRSDVATINGKLQGLITFSSNLPFAAQIVRTISTFMAQYPDVRVHIKRALTYEVVEDVEGSKVDFGLTGITKEPEHSELHELFQSKPLLVVHKNNPYKLPKKPRLSDLESLPFVSFLSERMDDSGDPYFGNIGTQLFTRKTVLSVNNYHLMLHYVLHGVGVAIMDEMCLKASSFGTDWRPLVSYPLDSFLPIVRYGILIRNRKHLSPQAKVIIERIKSEFGKTEKEDSFRIA